MVTSILPCLWQADRWQGLLLRSLSSGRVRECFHIWLASLISSFASSTRLVACYEAIEQWLLHGTGIQLPQRTTIRLDPITKDCPVLLLCQTSIITRLQVYLDSVELPIESFLHAKHKLVDIHRTNSTLWWVTKGFEGLRQCLRSISILEEAI